MRISTKGRYAIRLMVDIAVNGEEKNVSLKEISERQFVSVKYLEQIICMLKKADYVKSERGTNGGYKLTKKPSEYTVGMILRLTEGNLAPTPCSESNENCKRFGRCATSLVWSKINEAINDVVDNITLEELAEKEKECMCKCNNKK